MTRLIAIAATMAVGIAATACQQHEPCSCTYAEGEAFQRSIGSRDGVDDAYRAEWDLDGNGEVGAGEFTVWLNRCKAR